MYAKIIIAIDQLEEARHVLQEFLPLAASLGSSLVLTSVVPSYRGDLRLMGDSTILDSLAEQYRTVLEQAGEIVADRDLAATRRLLFGEPGEEIAALIAAEAADLVVIGKKTVGVAGRLEMDSLAANLLKTSSADILIIPQGRSLRLDRILLGYDGSRSAERAARKASDLALAYGSTCFLTTIYEMSMEAYSLSPGIDSEYYLKASRQQEPAAKMLTESGVREVHRLVEYGDTVYGGLSEAARRQEVGLAVLGTRRPESIGRMLLGSTAARFVASGSCPALVVKR